MENELSEMNERKESSLEQINNDSMQSRLKESSHQKDRILTWQNMMHHITKKGKDAVSKDKYHHLQDSFDMNKVLNKVRVLYIIPTTNSMGSQQISLKPICTASPESKQPKNKIKNGDPVCIEGKAAFKQKSPISCKTPENCARKDSPEERSASSSDVLNKKKEREKNKQKKSIPLEIGKPKKSMKANGKPGVHYLQNKINGIIALNGDSNLEEEKKRVKMKKNKSACSFDHRLMKAEGRLLIDVTEKNMNKFLIEKMKKKKKESIIQMEKLQMENAKNSDLNLINSMNKMDESVQIEEGAKDKETKQNAKKMLLSLKNAKSHSYLENPVYMLKETPNLIVKNGRIINPSPKRLPDSSDHKSNRSKKGIQNAEKKGLKKIMNSRFILPFCPNASPIVSIVKSNSCDKFKRRKVSECKLESLHEAPLNSIHSQNTLNSLAQKTPTAKIHSCKGKRQVEKSFPSKHKTALCHSNLRNPPSLNDNFSDLLSHTNFKPPSSNKPVSVKKNDSSTPDNAKAMSYNKKSQLTPSDTDYFTAIQSDLTQKCNFIPQLNDLRRYIAKSRSNYKLYFNPEPEKNKSFDDTIKSNSSFINHQQNTLNQTRDNTHLPSIFTKNNDNHNHNYLKAKQTPLQDVHIQGINSNFLYNYKSTSCDIDNSQTKLKRLCREDTNNTFETVSRSENRLKEQIMNKSNCPSIGEDNLRKLVVRKYNSQSISIQTYILNKYHAIQAEISQNKNNMSINGENIRLSSNYKPLEVIEKPMQTKSPSENIANAFEYVEREIRQREKNAKMNIGEESNSFVKEKAFKRKKKELQIEEGEKGNEETRRKKMKKTKKGEIAKSKKKTGRKEKKKETEWNKANLSDESISLSQRNSSSELIKVLIKNKKKNQNELSSSNCEISHKNKEFNIIFKKKKHKITNKYKPSENNSPRTQLLNYSAKRENQNIDSKVDYDNFIPTKFEVKKPKYIQISPNEWKGW